MKQTCFQILKMFLENIVGRLRINNELHFVISGQEKEEISAIR